MGEAPLGRGRQWGKMPDFLSASSPVGETPDFLSASSPAAIRRAGRIVAAGKEGGSFFLKSKREGVGGARAGIGAEREKEKPKPWSGPSGRRFEFPREETGRLGRVRGTVLEANQAVRFSMYP